MFWAAGANAFFSFSCRCLSGTFLNEFFRRHEEYFRKLLGDRLAHFPAFGLIVANAGGGHTDFQLYIFNRLISLCSNLLHGITRVFNAKVIVRLFA